jgi:aspartate aminotransferase
LHLHQNAMQVSNKAAHLIGSEIIKLAGEINALKAQGKDILNLTIGDFDPAVFPLPEALSEGIQAAYRAGETNYPPADGIAPLRAAVAQWYADALQLPCNPNTEVLVAGGGRPLIYAIYQAWVNPGEHVVYPVPSWNNNHYTYLVGGTPVELEALPENGFMPTPEQVLPTLETASLLALCSPLNPTGTVFTADGLGALCDAVLEENRRRANSGRRPVLVLYDQMYWTLTGDDTAHVHPVGLRPEMKEFTVYVDGISKSFAATGVRVGWSVGPAPLIAKMKTLLGHLGAWAPKPEQVAVARYLGTPQADQDVRVIQKASLERLMALHAGFQALKAEGFPVDSIAPQGAIYLSVRVDLPDATSRLLNDAGIALVPFGAFGASATSPWFRLSVGTLRLTDIEPLLHRLRSLFA